LERADLLDRGAFDRLQLLGARRLTAHPASLSERLAPARPAPDRPVDDGIDER
jgi:hypothetical protein